ncbi:MAG: hypothetical protein U5S82_16705 [Gammaproteobacteria bacterium]|nr:hypothetical protein [Gammaproteobacteria bacterium]
MDPFTASLVAAGSAIEWLFCIRRLRGIGSRTGVILPANFTSIER